MYFKIFILIYLNEGRCSSCYSSPVVWQRTLMISRKNWDLKKNSVMVQVWKNKLHYREQPMSQESLETKAMPTFWIRCKNDILGRACNVEQREWEQQNQPRGVFRRSGVCYSMFSMLFDVRRQDNVVNVEANKGKWMQVRVYCCEKSSY